MADGSLTGRKLRQRLVEPLAPYSKRDRQSLKMCLTFIIKSDQDKWAKGCQLRPWKITTHPLVPRPVSGISDPLPIILGGGNAHHATASVNNSDFPDLFSKGPVDIHLSYCTSDEWKYSDLLRTVECRVWAGTTTTAQMHSCLNLSGNSLMRSSKSILLATSFSIHVIETCQVTLGKFSITNNFW